MKNSEILKNPQAINFAHKKAYFASSNWVWRSCIQPLITTEPDKMTEPKLETTHIPEQMWLF